MYILHRPGALAFMLGLLLQPPLPAGLYVPPAKYLIISNARNGTIGYVKVPEKGNFSAVRLLVDNGLGHPQGIAVDQKRQLLLVADSALRKVVSYGLSLDKDGGLQVDEQTPLADDVESRWVAVDGLGNVFFSDEMGNRLLRVPARQVLDGDSSAAETVFHTSTGAAASVSAPGGVAVDNFYVYWANKLNGAGTGTVVRGLDVGANASTDNTKQDANVLVKNLPKAYGVCLAVDNVFYTAPERSVYAVKTGGGEATVIADSLASPRGCSWDGDSTVYVADRAAHGVFSFPAPMASLAQAGARKVVDFPDAFGVAVFSDSVCRWPSRLLWLLLGSALL